MKKSKITKFHTICHLLASGYIKIVSQSGRFPVYTLDTLGFRAASEYLELTGE